MRSLLLFALLMVVGGCGYTISGGLRAQAEPPVPEVQLFLEPELFLGRVVILGGNIIETISSEDGTYIEVLQKPLDSRGRPRETGTSSGHFVVFTGDVLDPAVYSEGRAITTAGEVAGIVEAVTGETSYEYPFIVSLELRLIGPRENFPSSSP